MNIPLHPLSYKILRTLYPEKDGMLHIPIGDIHHQLIHYQRKKYRGNLQKLSEILTTYAPIYISKKSEPRIKPSRAQIGYHILCYHRELFHTYVWAQKQAGTPASEAIDNFYEEYNVTEDDYSRESAYKRWQRYQNKKKRQKNVKNKYTLCPKDITPVADEKLVSEICGQIITKNINFFLQTPHQWHQTAIRDLYITVNLLLKTATPHQISQHLNCTQRNIHRAYRQTLDQCILYQVEISHYIRTNTLF